MPLKSTLAITVSLASIALASPASAEIARSADSFVNSVGVNVHLTYGDTSYGKTDMVLKRLRQLGVRYVRDGLCGSCAWQLGSLHRLAAAGIKSDLIMGNPNGKPDTLSHNVSAIKNSLLGSVVSVEGPNEWDMSGALSWASHLRTYQQQLWQDVKGDPALANMVVVGPSLALGSRPALGNLTPSLDYGNMHSYPGGAPPESNIGAQLRLGTTNSGSKPVMATETGYHNAMSATWGQPPVPQPVTASYIPRTFLSYFARGVVRTFTYELVDEWPGQEAKNPEASFGLLNADFSPKPAFTSLTNLLQTLADPGPRVPSRDVPLTVTARTGDLVHMLFHKRDGSLDLVLWRAASMWDQNAHRPISLKPASVKVSFGPPLGQASVVRPVKSPAATRLSPNRDGSFSLSVGGSPIILELAAPATAPGHPARVARHGHQPGHRLARRVRRSRCRWAVLCLAARSLLPFAPTASAPL